MNTNDDTIQMLLHLVRQEQRNHDAAQSTDLKAESDRQFRALMEQLHENPELRRAILRLTDTQTYPEGLHRRFFKVHDSEFILKPVKKLEQLFIAPKVRQVFMRRRSALCAMRVCEAHAFQIK